MTEVKPIPLPEAFPVRNNNPHYTAEQMLAYADAVRAEERERCAKVCETVGVRAYQLWRTKYDPIDQGAEVGAERCAAAIRATPSGETPL